MDKEPLVQNWCQLLPEWPESKQLEHFYKSAACFHSHGGYQSPQWLDSLFLSVFVLMFSSDFALWNHKSGADKPIKQCLGNANDQ
jgi:hypothetical protein